MEKIDFIHNAEYDVDYKILKGLILKESGRFTDSAELIKYFFQKIIEL
jgi:hypothetical protein